MSDSNAPKNGDFASYIESMSRQTQPLPEEAPVRNAPAAQTNISEAISQQERQTFDDVILNGEEPDDEFLEELAVLHELPPLSDEELAQQALAAPGADGDPSTPE